MALEKSIETSTGTTASYWRIVRIDIDMTIRQVWFLLGGYYNSAARQAGKDRLIDRPFTLAIPEGMEPEDMARSELYAYAKTSEEFAGAKDV